ncbi:MAG: amidohydrolase family protein [Actinomycetota bacterium]|nr:amidohydrolase family protein [Actinomycetota bacterium]
MADHRHLDNRRPPRLFDSHLHIIDPRFPLLSAAAGAGGPGWVPEPFTVADYRARMAALPLDVVGGAVVSGSFQGLDQSYLRDALGRLGAGYVGVTQLPATVPDERILALDAAGVRAVRFNLRRGGSERLERLEELAHRVFDLVGWHVEMYVDGRDLADLRSRLVALPAVVVDHLGLSREGLDVLPELVTHGVRVKASGFGRVDFDVGSALRRIAAVEPSALLFGTDLPSTRAPRPFRPADVDLVLDALGEQMGRRVLCDNAVALYRPPAPSAPPGRCTQGC